MKTASTAKTTAGGKRASDFGRQLGRIPAGSTFDGGAGQTFIKTGRRSGAGRRCEARLLFSTSKPGGLFGLGKPGDVFWLFPSDRFHVLTEAGK